VGLTPLRCAAGRNVVVNLRLRSSEARALGVEWHVCELQLIPAGFAQAMVRRQTPRPTPIYLLPRPLSPACSAAFSVHTGPASRCPLAQPRSPKAHGAEPQPRCSIAPLTTPLDRIGRSGSSALAVCHAQPLPILSSVPEAHTGHSRPAIRNPRWPTPPTPYIYTSCLDAPNQAARLPCACSVPSRALVGPWRHLCGPALRRAHTMPATTVPPPPAGRCASTLAGSSHPLCPPPAPAIPSRLTSARRGGRRQTRDAHLRYLVLRNCRQDLRLPPLLRAAAAAALRAAATGLGALRGGWRRSGRRGAGAGSPRRHSRPPGAA
jgi:hypothetical protein